MADLVGKTISHYRITEQVGQGGMGIVYKAEDTKLKRTVALKFLSSNLVGDGEEKKRFLREAQAAAALNHPNIATIHEIDEADGQTFIAMEFIEGKSLEEIVGDGHARPLPLPDAIDYATQTAAGLQAAHEKGITHRDIKSANIMVTDKGVVKIMDFGLAKLANRSKMTQLGTTLGTAVYMSPEQSRGENTDHRSDIWSLGVVLYEMISGQMPFKGDYEQVVIYSIQNEEPEPLTALRTGVPIALDGIIAKALAKDASTRYQNVEELPADLKVLNIQQSRASTPLMGRSRIGSGSILVKWQKLLFLIFGFAVFAAIGALGGRWLNSFSSSDTTVTRVSVALPTGHQFVRGGSFPAISISPDGRLLAYVAHGEGEQFHSDWRIYVRSLDSYKAKRLAGTGSAHTPFFSPDGKWIGFFSRRGQLKKVSVDGGPVQVIYDSDGAGATWGFDNSIIFAPFNLGGLWRVSAEGDEPQPVSKLDSTKERSHSRPQLLPDGQSVLFTITHLNKYYVDASIGVLSLRTGKHEVIIEGASDGRYVPTGHLLFRESNSLFAVPFDLNRLEVVGTPVEVLSGFVFSKRFEASQFALAANGTLVYLTGGEAKDEKTLVIMDETGRSRQIGESAPYGSGLKVSPDGKSTALSIESDIWLLEIERGTKAVLTAEYNNRFPLWMPDGESLVFTSNREGQGLYSMHLDGIKPVKRLTHNADLQMPVSVSRDGQLLAFNQLNSETAFDLWLLSLDGRSAPRPFRNSRFSEFWASFSPDGRWLAYSSRETGRVEVYVASVSGASKKLPISESGGKIPVWSPLGDRIFFSSYDDGALMAVDITTNPSLKAERPRVLFQVASPISSFDVMPDGKRFVVLQSTQGEPITRMNAVFNWFEELKQKVPVEN